DSQAREARDTPDHHHRRQGKGQRRDLRGPNPAAIERLGEHERKSLQAEFAPEGGKGQQKRTKAQRIQRVVINGPAGVGEQPDGRRRQQKRGGVGGQNQADFLGDQGLHDNAFFKVPAATKISSSDRES